MRVVDRIVELLSGLGADHVFGVHGANIEDLYDALSRAGAGVRGVIAKHEFSAATMADGYFRAGGRLGVVAATSGGGAMNLVPGIAEAYASGIPMLVLVGQPPRALEGRGAFQDSSGLAGTLDARHLFSSVSRYCVRVERPGDIDRELRRATAAAVSGRRGPSVLLLPKDVQQARVEAPAAPPARRALTPRGATHGPERVIAALRRVSRSRCPVLVIAGLGVMRADARQELAQLAARLGAWVAVEPDAKDAFDNHDPRFVGVSGVIGHPTVRECLERAGACVLVGSRLPQMAGGGLDAALDGKPLLCLDPEPPFPYNGRRPLWVGGELHAQLTRALAALEGVPSRDCPPHEGPRPLELPAPGHARMTCRAAVEAIAAELPDEANVVTDAGNASAGVIHFLPVPRGGRFVSAQGMGGMGHSFGAGLGAAFATGRRTFVLSGDGGFYMHGMEVHTAVEYDLPVTFVVFNNNAHAMCFTREQLFFGGAHTYNLFRTADIAGGVSAMFPTLAAERADTPAALRRLLARANATTSPALVAVDLDPRELPPFVPFLHHAA
jgi:acetolactate synthase-1/2/3 large subunit